MSPLAGRLVTKMNGLGNEILILDLRGTPHVVEPAAARALARDATLAFDQLMVLHDPIDPASAAFLRILNVDGSEAAACGNGTRCVAWFLGRESEGRDLRLDSAAGPLVCRRLGEWRFSVDMGVPRFGWADIPLRHAVEDTRAVPIGAAHGLPPAHLVSMGNPHAVFFVAPAAAPDLARVGPLLEHDALFPARANISFAAMAGRGHIRLRVWERGAGLTRACGSAACATLVAAARAGLADRRATVTLPGGDLTIDWRGDDHVIMEGPVELEAETRIDPRLLEAA